jgi:hypothetical protein
MNINYILTNSQNKQKMTWCHLYVLVSQFKDGVARAKIKNDMFLDTATIPNYFLGKGRGFFSFNFNKIKNTIIPHFCAFTNTEIYHLSRNYNDHFWNYIHDD